MSSSGEFHPELIGESSSKSDGTSERGGGVGADRGRGVENSGGGCPSSNGLMSGWGVTGQGTVSSISCVTSYIHNFVISETQIRLTYYTYIIRSSRSVVICIREIYVILRYYVDRWVGRGCVQRGASLGGRTPGDGISSPSESPSGTTTPLPCPPRVMLIKSRSSNELFAMASYAITQVGLCHVSRESRLRSDRIGT